MWRPFGLPRAIAASTVSPAMTRLFIAASRARFSLMVRSTLCLVHDLVHNTTPTMSPSSVTATSAPSSGTYRYFISAANIRGWRMRRW